jgi:DUF1680 family protein
MDHHLNRRDFLKTASVVSGVLASAGVLSAGEAAAAPVAPGEYPIQPRPFSDVTLTDTFWKPRVATNAAVTIPFEVRKETERGRPLAGNVLEAAMQSLRTHPDAALQAAVDSAVAAMLARPQGGRRGPLANDEFEAAATWFRTTGKRDLVDRAATIAAAIAADMREKDPPFSGGERDAINCLQLYTVTRDQAHLDLAKHYLDIRGLPNSLNRSRHNQSYKPVLEQSEAVGHAVNCVSLMVSLADVGTLSGDRRYFDAAQRMWTDAVTRKMYVTGGVGSTGNEGFGEPYALPNLSAYSETCAVLMFITLNHKLFQATGDSRYIDVMERGMYNNAVDGVSASGDRFFYVNRLASAGDGRDERWARASLECCPPNLVRFLSGMAGLTYAQDRRDAIYVNLYVSSAVSFAVAGSQVSLSVQSGMPWSGSSRIAVSSPAPVQAAIKLRIPGWARNQPVPGGLYSYLTKITETAAIAVNRTAVPAVPDASGYVTITRRWSDGDVIDVDFPMEIRRVVANARVRDTRGRMAIERGPIVYCAEWPEARDGRVLDLLVDPNAAMTAVADPALFGGATVIHTEARRLTRPSEAASPLTLIPYSLWANRGAGEMTVWLSKSEYAPGDIGPAGGYVFFVNPNYAADGWRYLEAAPIDQSMGAKWGCFRRAIDGARGTAIGTGRQNTREMLAACDEASTAAALCATYRLNGVGGWFLPSREELAALYRNLKAAGIEFPVGAAPDNVSYWTSSQETADMASHIDFADGGRQHYDDKDFPRRVRAIRAF